MVFRKDILRFSAFPAQCLRIFSTILAIHGSAYAAQPAFPNAIGFGKNAVGWRGGEVVAITNLQDSGPGSLRNCVENTKKPRICVFDVSGTIFLKRPLFFSSNLYLAGQTAPGQGIQLRLQAGNSTPVILKNTTNVLIRFLKIRPGAGPKESANIDAITVESSQFIYLDALSMQFASDETFNIHVNKMAVQNVTLARSILSHSLDHSVHPKGRHSKGALICSHEGPASMPLGCGVISLVQNLFAHNRDRNPDVKGTDIGPIEIINNVFYNPISQLGEFYDLLGTATIYYIGNVTQSGPSTKRAPLTSVEAFDWHDDFDLRIFEQDNINLWRNACAHPTRLPILDPEAEKFRILIPEKESGIVPRPAETLRVEIGGLVGAQLPQWGGLDKLDAQAVMDFETCEGKVIDTPEQAGGWPDLIKARRDPDSDGDGMPDSWENMKSGLSASLGGQAWGDRDNDGWSNLEEYLSWLAGDTQKP
nr:hypothetical protein [Amylibacter sp.]